MTTDSAIAKLIGVATRVRQWGEEERRDRSDVSQPEKATAAKRLLRELDAAIAAAKKEMEATP